MSNCAGRTILAAPFGRTVSDEREELLTPTGVRIGEEGNLAMLTYKEWNLLIDLIQAGELTKVPV